MNWFPVLGLIMSESNPVLFQTKIQNQLYLIYYHIRKETNPHIRHSRNSIYVFFFLEKWLKWLIDAQKSCWVDFCGFVLQTECPENKMNGCWKIVKYRCSWCIGLSLCHCFFILYCMWQYFTVSALIVFL